MENKTKAIIYARVSSERQKNEGHGLDSQEQRCRAHAEGKGYTVEKVFKDSFTGGGDFMQRPAMTELLTYLEERPHVNYVVVFDDLKRLARDTVAHIKLRKQFDALDAKVECPNFTFEDTPEGEFIETILAAQGQLERKQNKRQVIQKQKARLEAGYWPFYPPPGYVQQKHPLHGKLLVADEPKAGIIQEALEGFASGRFQDQVDVQKFLNAKGFYKGNKSKKIYLDQVKRLLTRILYAGYIEYPDWEVARRKGHHQGLVSLETYLKVQERLSGKVKSYSRKDLNPDFPLRGMVNCASCLHPFTASWSKGSKSRFPYYRCNTTGCSDKGKSIRKNDIETAFGTILKAIKPRQEVLDYAKARLLVKWDKRLSELNLTQQTREKELEDIRQEIRNFSDLAGKAKDDRIRGAYEARLAELIDKEVSLEVKAHKPKQSIISFGTAVETVFEYLKNPYAKWQMGDLAEKRLVIKLVFSELLVYDRKEGFGTSQLALPLKVFEVISTSENVACGRPSKFLEHQLEGIESFILEWGERLRGGQVFQNA